MLDYLGEELKKLRNAELYRDLKTITKNEACQIIIDGQTLLNFCSNNYLGLADHPQVVAAANAATTEFGFGAGASRLISGNTALHEQLEKKLAAFKGQEAALLFPTGYQANLGTVTALTDENDTIIIDRLNHASIIDACRLSKAKLQVYKHRDPASLEAVLKRSARFKKRLVVTDSLFSMDGDLAPLPEIVKLAERYQAITMIDEAHATGVLGPNGKGVEEYFGVRADIVMGTLSKALGSLGGFIAGSAELIAYLRNKARSFIYTTALPPAACAAALAALAIIEQEPVRKMRLWRNINLFASLYPLAAPPLSPIIPIIVGDNKKTVMIAQQLFERGFFVSAIRPPTVPEGSARLRITITSEHTEEEITCLASSLRELIPA